MIKKTNEHTQLLRQSLFISLFSFFETQFFEYCCFIGDDNTLRFEGIDQAKNYLSKNLKIGFSFGSSSEWGQIQQYRRLRNCIVHSQGVVSAMGREREKRLNAYITSRGSLLSLSSDNSVILQKGFCEKVFAVIQDFLWSLLVSVSDQFYNKKVS